MTSLFLSTIPAIDATESVLALTTAVVAYLVLHGGVQFLRKRLAAREALHGNLALSTVNEMLAGTSGAAVLAVALLTGASTINVAPPWSDRIQHLWFIVLGVQCALYASRALSIAAQRYVAVRTGDAAAPVTVAHTLMLWFCQAVLWAVFLLAMLANLGINVTTFVASLGIGGIAVALAVQNILGDLFASLSIAVDKPFEVGDAISVSGVSGTVEQVGLKTTRVRADSGEQIVIANAEMLKNVLRNFKRMSTRRVQFSLRLDPSLSASVAARIPAMVQQVIVQQPQVRFDRAHLKSVDPICVEFEIVYFMLTPAYGLFMDTQQAILLALMAALDKLGVSTLAPTQRVLYEQSDARTAQNDSSINPTQSTH
ncbi:MAG: mechanosensitive ion channel family protein [Pseudomonadota bacterium]|nr:mechanosensitive ion channel family protein [Pseudomonadota bacterium]